MTTKNVKTRFAPSPTGFLHIGGARTALFNWLFSKHMGGEFHLRIEDTDLARSTPEATQAILDGMAWLGLSHDGDIVYQSQNAQAHTDIAHELLAKGAAYKCYCSPQELEDLRAAQHESGGAFRSPYRDQDASLDKPYTVRFKVPEGETRIHDHVQGDITWQNTAFDDLVLLRADGTPTYMLAVVVDDHNMGITHVIRGDDHLINAGRQSQIYAAMGWNIPDWAHVPLIHGPDGKKLSKRHGALGVEAHQDMGYLPEGLRNYLLKLGWSHGDQELFFGDEAINAFTLGGLNSSPARLDFDKMEFINGQHMAVQDDDILYALAVPFLQQTYGDMLNEMALQRVKNGTSSLKTRSKTLIEFTEQAKYLAVTRPIDMNGKAKKAIKTENISHLQAMISHLDVLEYAEWTPDKLDDVLQAYVADNAIGFGKIGQPMRAALTGGAPSPDLSLVLYLLGKSESVGRLSDAIENER